MAKRTIFVQILYSILQQKLVAERIGLGFICEALEVLCESY